MAAKKINMSYPGTATSNPDSSLPASLRVAPWRPGNLAGHRSYADLPHSCRCGARWDGSRTAHCGADCHLTFAGPTAFDEHRFHGTCRAPAAVGMSLLPSRAYLCWGRPTEATHG